MARSSGFWLGAATQARPYITPGDVLLSHAVSSAVPSGLRGLTAVFGMGTGVTPSLGSPGKGQSCWRQPKRRAPSAPKRPGPEAHAPSKFYGQAERAISSGELHPLLGFHLRPIKQVVFLRPSYPAAAGLGDLILGRVSRLYAFSAYPDRTSLPSRATGRDSWNTRGPSAPVLSY